MIKETKMKRMIATTIIATVLVAFSQNTISANEISSYPGEIRTIDYYEEPQLIRCTCYTSAEGAITRSGQAVREGIVAGKEEWLGCVALMWDEDMNFIGIFEFLDTGAGIDTDGDGLGDSIKNGTSIDMYRDSMNDVREWISQYGDYVYIQIVEGKG